MASDCAFVTGWNLRDPHADKNKPRFRRKIDGLPAVYTLIAADAPAAELKARASSEPLGTGRKLVEKDVNANLKGRQAELFWPDDNLWYLVEILAVNHRSKKATIQYTTGETEELELGEIIRDGHMSLITK